MNSLLRVVSCLSVLLASLLLVGTAPAAADTMLENGQTLPLSSYAAHVVDEARGRIYVTAGPGDNRMAVTDLQGQPIQTVEGLTGAGTMALTDDGTSLFVALETHRVVRLDAETLTVAQTYELPDFQQAVDLAWADGRLWVVVAEQQCCTRTVHALDPTTGERAPVTGLRGSSPVLASTAGGHLLVLMRSTEAVSSVDTDSGAVVATREFVDRVTDLRTSSTGQPYVLTYEYTDDLLVRLDPATLETVGSTQLTSRSAVEANNTIVASATGDGLYDARGVDVRDADSSTRLNRFRLNAGTGVYPVVIATILTSSGMVVLHQESERIAASYLSDPSSSSTTLSLSPSPPGAYVGRETTLTGTLTDRGAPIAGAEVRIVDQPGYAEPGAATRTRTVATAQDGTFSFPYTPRTWNDILTLEYAGDDVHPAAWQQVYSDFDLQPTSLSVAYPSTPAPNEPITFTGTLTALGEPVQGADIEVREWCTRALPFTVHTDDAGRFDLTVVPGRCQEAPYTFDYEGTATYGSQSTTEYVRPTWATSATTLVQPAEAAPVGSTWAWSGTVTSAGSAAADVPVTYTITRSYTGTQVASGTTRTDTSGGFRVVETIDDADRYTLVVRYAGDNTTLESSRGDEFQVTRIPAQVIVDDPDIQALPGDPITLGGQVTTTDGTPIGNHPIEIWRDGGRMDPLRTDAEGRFQFETVPQPPQNPYDTRRDYRVDVLEDSRYAGSSAMVRVTVAPEPTRLVLDDVPASSTAGDQITLGGRLTRGTGEPLAGHEVVLTHTDGRDRTLHAVTDDQGRFSVQTVVRTGYRQYLTARFPGTRVLGESSSSVHWNSTPLPGDLTLKQVAPRLVGEAFTVGGRLTDADGNGATSWVTVSRINEAGVTEWTSNPVQTAADGSFSLPVWADAVGRYTFLARSDMWRVAAQSDSIVVDVRRLRLTTTALRPEAVKGDWSVYDARQDPLVRTSTNPARGGLCVAHEVQRQINGTWRPIATPQCKDTGAAGTVSQRIDVRHPAGSRFRVRAVQESATTTLGAWELIRFR